MTDPRSPEPFSLDPAATSLDGRCTDIDLGYGDLGYGGLGYDGPRADTDLAAGADATREGEYTDTDLGGTGGHPGVEE